MTLPCRLHHFGADALAEAPGWHAALRILAAEDAAPTLAVVSTPAPAQAALEEALRAADRGRAAEAQAAGARALGVLEGLALDLGVQAAFSRAARDHGSRWPALLQGACLVGHASPRTRDAAAASLASLAGLLLETALTHQGRRAALEPTLPPAAGDPGRARPAGPAPPPPSPGTIRILPGGFGHGQDGRPLGFGAGGSELGAVALGAAWELPDVRLWTLEEGVRTADPFLVPEARPLSRLSYGEARALSGLGSRTLHTEVLARAETAGLTLVVGHLDHPGAATRISADIPPRRPGSVASVAYREGLHLLRLPAAEDLETARAVDEDLRAAGGRRHGAILSPEGTLLVMRVEGPEAVARLAAWTDRGVQAEPGWALVALVGEGLRATPGIALRLLAPLGLETVGGLLAGSSPISVSFLVPEERLGALIPRLHRLLIAPGSHARAPVPLAL